MASKKAGGSTQNGRDSNPKYLGVKKFGSEAVIKGNIIVRQRGNKFYAGDNVGTGRDFTLFALENGFVQFKKGFKGRKFISVNPNTNNNKQ